MRVIGVVDLLAGRAVHARAGRRNHYEPVRAVAGSPIDPGDALSLARGYRQLGVTELYAADLDAILGGVRAQPDVSSRLAGGSHEILSALAALAPLWLDAGVSSVDRARKALALGAARVVVGLETLPSFTALEDICAAVGPERVAFSLDLRNGEPIVTREAAGEEKGIGPREPAAMAARAVQAGVGAVIVIDLARVGAGVGVDLDLLARVRESAPQVALLAGGGVRGLDDLARLAEAGCDGALVATALHDGRLGADDMRAAHRFGHSNPTR